MQCIRFMNGCQFHVVKNRSSSAKLWLDLLSCLAISLCAGVGLRLPLTGFCASLNVDCPQTTSAGFLCLTMCVAI